MAKKAPDAIAVFIYAVTALAAGLAVALVYFIRQ
jgi:hypothetical protein